MVTSSPESLRNIKRFDQLVAYLRDELDWPIETDDLDELSYEYEPEELGLNAKTAAKIKSPIRQMRPLTSDQPWGIFFIEFEPKRLPVVVLRKILGQLVLRKREFASPAERKRWLQSDLLFVSAYGEDEQRHISFAHFVDEGSGALPSLRILGWNVANTALHIDYVNTELHENLTWPEDNGRNASAWRSRWAEAFKLRLDESIKTSKELAIRLADLARGIRRLANDGLTAESDSGPLRTLHKAFQQALIHDLGHDDFADMYAQTIAYGLLSARVSRHVPGEDPVLLPEDLANLVLPTNPFLKELLETFLRVGGRKSSRKNRHLVGIDFDELGINDVVELLKAANMDAVLRDFGDKNPQEDPVIHFYESFLKEYDAKKRMQRGVFYTPRPVVSFIVRSVDELLRTEFGLEDGLADTTTWGEMVARNPDLKLPEIEVTNPETNKVERKPIDASKSFVQVLDPATGTGTFLVEVIKVIALTMKSKWGKEFNLQIPAEPEDVVTWKDQRIVKLWNDYVPKHLLTRLHGYELMMAPYAIAHMKIGLKLHETGYRFESDQRVRVYLTNSLEPPHDFSGTLAFAIPALAHEAEAVNAIKRHQRFTVVIGNPPYSVLSANLSETSRKIVDIYRQIAGKKIVERSMLRLEMHLQDDYVKFLALSQAIVRHSQAGVLGFITNGGYLDNLTLRGVRHALQQQFTKLSILNLHGSRQRCPAPGDENVFDIEQGVAILLGVAGQPAVSVQYSEIVGSRNRKYGQLLRNSVTSEDCVPLTPRDPHYFLVPRDDSGIDEYESFVSLVNIMPVNISGIVTAHDNLVVDFDDDRLIRNAAAFRNHDFTDEEVRSQVRVKDNAGWKLTKARKKMKGYESDQSFLKPYAYRPFDIRRIYYHTALVWSDRRNVMSHTIANQRNFALATCRQLAQLPWEHVFVTRQLQDDCYISNRTRERSYHFPLYLYGESRRRGEQGTLSFELSGEGINFSLEFFTALENKIGSSPIAEEVFAYIYGILYSPRYREKYREFLRVDFPRIPLPSGSELFSSSAQLGQQLVALHLMDSPKLDNHITTLIGAGDFQIEKVSYSDETVWIDKEKTRGFRGVPEEVWNFQIGCYQVCNKWLKDRQAKGGKNPRPSRVLTDEDIDHYQRIVVALNETIRIMAEIDEVIESHGGWPDAFVTEKGI